MEVTTQEMSKVDYKNTPFNDLVSEENGHEPSELPHFNEPINFSTESTTHRSFPHPNLPKIPSIQDNYAYETKCSEQQKSSFLDFYRNCSQDLQFYNPEDYQDRPQHPIIQDTPHPERHPMLPYFPYTQPWSTPHPTHVSTMTNSVSQPLQHYETDLCGKYFSSQNSLTVRDKSTEEDNSLIGKLYI